MHDPITQKNKPNQFMLLFGGTFDPIHIGHTKTAEEAARYLNADNVRIIPTHTPVHKNIAHANAKHRLHMIELICNNSALFQVDTREIFDNTPSYTIDTLEKIKAENTNTSLCFIMGLDSLLSFTTWHRWQDILKICNIIVNVRPGYHLQQLSTQLTNDLLAYITDNLETFKQHSHGKIMIHACTPYLISSTQIRDNIARGENCQTWLDARVFNYIKEQHLYKNS